MWKKLLKYGFRIAIGASMIAAIIIGPVMGCSFNDIGSSNDMTPDFNDTPVHPSLGLPLRNQLNKSKYEERRKLLEAEIPEKCELDEDGMPIGDCEPPNKSRKGKSWREGRGILNWILDKSISEETIYRSNEILSEIDIYNYELISCYLHSIESVDEAEGIYNLPLKGTVEEQDRLIEEMFRNVRYQYQQAIYTSGPELPLNHQVNRGNRRYWTSSKYPIEEVSARYRQHKRTRYGNINTDSDGNFVYEDMGYFSSDVDFLPYSKSLIQKLKGKQGYFLHFTADWCGICIVQRPYINNDKVNDVLEELDIVPIKADFTRSNPAALRALKSYNRVGIPFYVFVDKDGNETTLDFIGSTQITLKHLRDLNK